MDTGHRVIYCGTFSKVLFPGARVGWLAAPPECIRRLAVLRRYGELSPPPLLQAALARFCSEGHYERHISRMHRVYRKRMQIALAALKRCVSPEWAAWTQPAGGYLIWLSMAPSPPADWEKILASEKVSAFGKVYERKG
jgi:DNA-binding transcriptional MocR family regulator